MKSMHFGHWLLVGLALYEAAQGVYELSQGTTISGLPSVGNLIGGSTGGTSYAGYVDLGVAALLFIVPLHHQLKA